jgi:hypothetical protein
MKHIVWVFGLAAGIAASSAAAQPESAAVIAKRQLTECMNRHMAASKTVSYNEAMRTCKAKLQPPKDTLASNGINQPESKAR